MTKDQIQKLQIGQVVRECIDTRNGKALPGARYGQPRKVTAIFGRGISVHGNAYVCFYTEFGPNSEISGACSEGEERYEVVP